MSCDYDAIRVNFGGGGGAGADLRSQEIKQEILPLSAENSHFHLTRFNEISRFSYFALEVRVHNSQTIRATTRTNGRLCSRRTDKSDYQVAINETSNCVYLRNRGTAATAPVGRRLRTSNRPINRKNCWSAFVMGLRKSVAKVTGSGYVYLNSLYLHGIQFAKSSGNPLDVIHPISGQPYTLQSCRKISSSLNDAINL